MHFFFFFEQTKWDHSPIPNAEAGLVANILTNNSSQIGNLTINDLCDKRKNPRCTDAAKWPSNLRGAAGDAAACASVACTLFFFPVPDMRRFGPTRAESGRMVPYRPKHAVPEPNRRFRPKL